MIVLALDLASRQSGWAIFEDNRKKKIPNKLVATGVIIPKPRSLSADERLPIIEKEVKKILEEYKPTFAILENPAGGVEDKTKGPTANWLTMSVLFLTHGVIRNEFIKQKIKYDILSPSTWQNRLGFFKRDRVGRKAAAKEYAIKQYNVDKNLEQDEYDSICLFDCWIYLQDWNKEKNDNQKEISAF